MAILKLTSVSLPLLSGKSKAAHQTPSHSRRPVDSSWKIPLSRVFPNIASMTSNTPTPHSPVHSDIQERSLSADFDISYFYGTAPSLRSSPQSLQALTIAMAAPIPFIPLSFARYRRDIRRRNEDFEAADETVPFAVRTQNLIPLRDALARDDIRRRLEGFELAEEKRSTRRDGMYLGSSPWASCSMPNITSEEDMQIAETGMRLSTASTVPSVYSTASWLGVDVDDVDGLEIHSISVLFDADLSPENSLVDDASGRIRRLCDVTDLSTSSFDEESFLRMASSLGW